MAFPLDYSQKEIEDTQKLWDVDRHNINRISLRTLVTENQRMGNALVILNPEIIRGFQVFELVADAASELLEGGTI